ncbi:carbamoyltransferase family protein [Chitinasiproducens palmae]|uniref:Beta-1,4-N-acetylglucosamine oligosaccharide 6-O-carbamoyltransferase NodU n=1 Tax=Chitinasiproducens palmae TaxID=1770053 RepID=A0A1H2PSJ9_9BURK|nr:carbamoyltransferase C-terminal domain-containing protein [Chitinasiproducens palmae]SDV49121.1 beta-1,4-N-acetylglucosamine oligosaccharide 6-O-carbamoyltransferase NodU [Chitinasiproducens palmae]
MYTLGINAVYHDSAAVLIKDGVVIAAAEDERFTHIKHAKRALPFSTWLLPFDAIDFCLKTAGIALADVDHVAYSYDPALLLKEARGNDTITLPLEPSKQAFESSPDNPNGSPWDPLFLSFIVNAPAQLVDGAPHHLEKRFRRPASGDFKFQWHYVDHHLAHEASAFLAAPYEQSAVLTMDGRGERATTSYGIFENGDYRRIKQIDLPDSLGLLYEEVTEHLGFLRSSDEYKVMALASYGKPTHLDLFREVLRYRGDGVYTVAKVDWSELLGPKRVRGSEIEQRHYDIAHSLQRVLEETVLDMCRWLHEQTGQETLVMAGGVALNCVLNARVRDRSPFKNVWVQPAAGDAGTALGAALWTDYKQRGDNQRKWQMDHAYLGPEYSDDEIEAFLKWSKLSYRKVDDIVSTAANLLAAGNVIGWFQGRMEFGPRALGARSILASPVDPDMQAKLNNIKDREDFRPVAPVVMEQHAGEWFKDCGVAPFMLFVYDVKDEAAQRIPAVRHVDGTARVQTVNAAQHPRYYALLDAFRQRTGVPVLVNTSFNTRGEPMVCSPRDAIESFWTSPLDALVIGNFLLEKQAAATAR